MPNELAAKLRLDLRPTLVAVGSGLFLAQFLGACGENTAKPSTTPKAVSTLSTNSGIGVGGSSPFSSPSASPYTAPTFGAPAAATGYSPGYVPPPVTAQQGSGTGSILGSLLGSFLGFGGSPTSSAPGYGYSDGYPQTGYPAGSPGIGYPGTTGYPSTGYPSSGYPPSGYQTQLGQCARYIAGPCFCVRTGANVATGLNCPE